MPEESRTGPTPPPLSELQQLEAALAAGVITPELFATLTEKLRAALPVAPPPAPAPRSVPPATKEELPSLLDMFSRAPAPTPASPPPAPAPAEVRPPTPPPAAEPVRPLTTAAEDAAARQRIEEHLARLRQAPPAVVPPPTFLPEPPAPTFFPEPKPAPTFFPEPQPAPRPAPVPPPAPPKAAARPRVAPKPETRGRSWLVVLVLLAIMGALAYYFTSSSHPDEVLTSSERAPAERPPVEAPAPKTPERVKPAHRAAKHKKKAALAAPKAAPAPDSTETLAEETPAKSPAPAPPKAAAPPDFSRPIAAAAEAGDDAATTKVRAALASYYADLFAPPLHASEHFAPQVERLYTSQNLTPAAIDAELARSFFPENQRAVCQVEPGTLHVSDPAADGSRTATFIERMRLYRVSLQKYQRLRTQVRVRFNADNKIVFMRQEKLLTNLFEE